MFLLIIGKISILFSTNESSIYVDIMIRENFWLLLPFSFIGQFIHLVEGEGWGARRGRGIVISSH